MVFICLMASLLQYCLMKAEKAMPDQIGIKEKVRQCGREECWEKQTREMVGGVGCIGALALITVRTEQY